MAPLFRGEVRSNGYELTRQGAKSLCQGTAMLRTLLACNVHIAKDSSDDNSRRKGKDMDCDGRGL